STGPMTTGRYRHTATLLTNGEVLVMGGRNNTDTTLASAELYEPRTGRWTRTGAMHGRRWNHTATLLRDGMVLVAGAPETTFADLIAHPRIGFASGPSAELYDSKTGHWTITGPMITGRADQAAVLLPGGTVLVAGGSCGGTYVNGKPTDLRCLDTLASAELYTPRLKTWALTAPLHMARLNPTATLLPNGTVLVTGGVGTKGVVASAEVYNPWQFGPAEAGSGKREFPTTP